MGEVIDDDLNISSDENSTNENTEDEENISEEEMEEDDESDFETFNDDVDLEENLIDNNLISISRFLLIY